MSVVTIPVQLPQAQYDIVIAPNYLDHLGAHMAHRQLKGKVMIVSHPVIFEHYGSVLQTSLRTAGFQVSACLLPAGEQHKTLDSIQSIYDAALTYGLERSSTLLALGGGVIGDMAGFAAATWLRGIRFVQVPTSLLAMVDAAIGGKTGVNHPQGKNLIGAFYQPRLVWIDPTVLETLPPREFRSALAEVIKYGVIQDPELFTFLEGLQGGGHYGDFSPVDLQRILIRSAECKAYVVQQDETEKGLRAILNYGHTLGHALESVTHYKDYLHGEAVAIGMVAAGAIAETMGWWSTADAQRQQQLINHSGLPTDWPTSISFDAIATIMQADKKVENGRVRFILPHRVGQVSITDQVSQEVIRHALTQISQ